MKKLLSVITAVICTFTLLSACGKSGVTELSYIDNGPVEGVTNPTFDTNLFYRNDLTTIAADPSTIFVTEGSQAGYFYMYATSDEIGVSGYQCWRSKDLVNWECRGVAFAPSRDSWAIADYWAPEVIYDDELDTYFMYYSATDRSNGVKSMGLATSKTPNGPFIQYTDEVKGITLSSPLFDFTKMPDDHPLTGTDEKGKKIPMKVIDASPFKDPVTGDKYLYFVHDRAGGGIANNYKVASIYVMKLTDWYTPDYSTVKEIAVPNKVTPKDTAETASLAEGEVNEGPFMYGKDGKYYLTYSVNEYTNKGYAVRTAVSDSPDGVFRKLTKEEGGYLLGADMMWDHASGTGHHSFAQAGDELFIIYHAHTDREFGGTVRAIAGDRVMFINNADGLSVPFVNGPTYSPQPLAAAVSGYRNIASEATIKATSTASDSDTKLLQDGLIKFHAYAVDEYRAKAGTSVITLSFEDYMTTCAVMVYNSYDFEAAFDHIDSIEFDFRQKGYTGTAVTKRLNFDWATYATAGLSMRPGGAFIVEYADLEVKEIRITVTNKTAFAISDIAILGK